VKVFCRSMTYCHSFVNFTYPNWIKWMFRRIPGLLALYANVIACAFAIWAWFVFRPEKWLAKYEERYCQRLLKKKVSDPILRQQLEPKGRFGAKRPLVSLAGFFDVLQEDNVEVISEPITAIDSNGVITKARPSGNDAVININEHSREGVAKLEDSSLHVKVDVLIWGTGFKMQGWGGAVPTMGRKGLLLSEHWEDCPITLYGKRYLASNCSQILDL
jgi:hypothetical protein